MITLATPILDLHYSPGMLTVLRWVDGTVPIARSHTGLGMSDRPVKHWAIVNAPVFLKKGEQHWVLERSWIPKGGENHGQQQGQWEEAPENRSTTV